MHDLIPPEYNVDQGIFPNEPDQISSDLLQRYLSNSKIDWRTVSWPYLLTPYRNRWVNIDAPLMGEWLMGKIVVLDFFTYCCINCVHILPYLKRLEKAYHPGEVQVIGVHSAKFVNEKISENIAQAVARYEIEHAVVNDVDCALWKSFHVRCWPTVAVCDTKGRVVFWLEGEGKMEHLEKLVGALRDYCQKQGTLKGRTEGTTSYHAKIPENSSCAKFRFPGKVSINPSKQLLAVSDSGNHRIVVLKMTNTENGTVLAIIGQTGRPGSMDGDYTVAQFHSPQGVCWLDEETLLVADTENHTIRKVDLRNKLVSRIGGTGRQGQDYTGGRVSIEQEISSPWDIVVAEIEPSKRALLIAAAGTHQIWILPLSDTIMSGKRRFEGGHLYCFAGSGREAARNNSYPHQAAFAQPSGLCIAGTTGNMVVYVADSESSSIRAVELKNGSVKNVVGGDKDPQNLFAFGDVDGVGFDAKLQHPLAVCFSPENGTLYIADSYNHKIKRVDTESRQCQTIPLNFGESSINKLNEPGGICAAWPVFYIADTNHHAIWTMDIQTGHLRQLQVDWNRASCDLVDGPSPNAVAQIIRVPSPPNGGPLKLKVRLSNLGDQQLNTSAHHSWKISVPEGGVVKLAEDATPDRSVSGPLQLSGFESILPEFYMGWKDPASCGSTSDIPFQLDLVIYLCNSSTGLCSMHSRQFQFTLTTSNPHCDQHVLLVDWKL